MTQKEKGALGEQVARRYALRHGMEFLESNYHSRYGEIDLICKDTKETLVFIEVKLRSERPQVSGLESIGVRKRNNIIKTACEYMQKNDIEMMVRFDVMEIRCNNKARPKRINYIKNAFWLEELNEIF